MISGKPSKTRSHEPCFRGNSSKIGWWTEVRMLGNPQTWSAMCFSHGQRSARMGVQKRTWRNPTCSKPSWSSAKPHAGTRSGSRFRVSVPQKGAQLCFAAGNGRKRETAQRSGGFLLQTKPRNDVPNEWGSTRCAASKSVMCSMVLSLPGFLLDYLKGTLQAIHQEIKKCAGKHPGSFVARFITSPFLNM